MNISESVEEALWQEAEKASHYVDLFALDQNSQEEKRGDVNE